MSSLTIGSREGMTFSRPAINAWQLFGNNCIAIQRAIRFLYVREFGELRPGLDQTQAVHPGRLCSSEHARFTRDRFWDDKYAGADHVASLPQTRAAWRCSRRANPSRMPAGSRRNCLKRLLVA